MLAPQRKRRGFLALIRRAIVNARNAVLMARDVVQHRLDDMWLHTHLGHVRRDRAAQIVMCPGGEGTFPCSRNPRVEASLEFRPA